MIMTALIITCNPQENTLTYSGITSKFKITGSGTSVATSSFTLMNFTGKENDILGVIPLAGFGTLRADTRAGYVDGLDGPGFYYGAITSISNKEQEEQYEISCSDLKYYLNNDYSVEPAGASINGPLAWMVSLCKKWTVLSPLAVEYINGNEYTGPIKNIRYPTPTGASTANLVTTINEYFTNYGITFVPYGDLLRNPMAPMSSNDNLLPYDKSSASTTVNGVTFISNGDGSYSVNGTCNAVESLYTLANKTPAELGLKLGSTYEWGIYNSDDVVKDHNCGVDIWSLSPNGSWSLVIRTTTKGNGHIPSDSTRLWVRLRVGKAESVNQETVYPYILLNGVKENLYDGNVTSSSNNGITYYNNNDGSYTLNGTCNAEESLCTLWIEELKNTDYKIGSEYTAGLDRQIKGVTINIWRWDGSKWDGGLLINSETSGKFKIPSDTKKIWIRIKVARGISLESATIRPYVCMATGAPYQCVFGTFISGKHVGTLDINPSSFIRNDADVFIRPKMNGKPNGIAICTVQKDTNGNFTGVNIDRRYLTGSGTIVQTPDDPTIDKPIKMTVYNYSPEEETVTNTDGSTNKKQKIKTADEIAGEELKIQQYAHEISFSISKYHPMANELIRIGNTCTLVHKNRTLESIVTGFTIDSTEDFVEIKCGNVNSTLDELVKKAQSETTSTSSNSTNNVSTSSSTTTSSSTGGSANVNIATVNDITNIILNRIIGG